MAKLFGFRSFAVLAFAGAGLLGTGCKSAPDLTNSDALVLLQADYDRRPAEGLIVMVDRTGLKQGLNARYWKLTKVYPNQRWADYTLTPEGKAVVTLNGGGDVIQWRPDDNGDAHFLVTTLAATHPRVLEVSDPQDDVVANVQKAKSASFVEGVNFDGLPQPIQDIAHNPGNTLSTRREADFSLENGAWKVHSIR